MNILVTGAAGFIASQIVTDLLAAGHSVTGAVRNTEYAKNIFPTMKIIQCDFIRDTTPELWVERLKGIDLVINCVGIFHHPNKKIIWAIHHDTPRALFDACVKVGVKKIIQISALGVDKSDVPYSVTKKAADDYLTTLPIPSVILRPSLVYGRGSYGGTSLFRGLVGLPFITPVPGPGTQEFQPIHLQDLSKAVVKLVNLPSTDKILLNAVSSKRMNLNEILTKMRAWLGFQKSVIVHTPLWIIRIAAFFGDFIPYSGLNTTAYKMMMQNNVTTAEETQKFHDTIGFTPRDYSEGLYSQPSTVQDHWHSRLFFLKPVLQNSIAFIWLFTAFCSVFLYPRSASYQLLGDVGVSEAWQPLAFYGASLLDAILGVAMLIGYRLKLTGGLQLLAIGLYTAVITWKLPQLWIEPFMPIAKNIPLVVATLVFLAMESDR